MVCQLPDDMVDEVPPLVADELDWATVTAPEVFIYKFRRGCCRVVSESLGLNPFCAVVRGHDDILISGTGRGWLERSYKI